MFANGGPPGVASGAANAKAASAIFARFAVRIDAGRSTTVPLTGLARDEHPCFVDAFLTPLMDVRV